jgi:uncharacterized protein YndB with AHSA1/START domain
MKNEPIVKEITINAPVSKVWKAITDKDEMKHWYFDLEAFKPEVGFEFQFYGGSEEKQYLHLCKITEVEPGKTLIYSWKYDGYPGESFVTFELFAEGDDTTRVRLTHTGVESFAGNGPDFAVTSFTAGWNEIIGTSLKDYIEKTGI